MTTFKKVKTKKRALPEAVVKSRDALKDHLVQAVAPSDIYVRIFVPDTHTAGFNNEIYESLVLTWEIDPPPGDVGIENGEICKLKITVSNNYEVKPGNLQFANKRIPTVWFKNVYICLFGINYGRIVNGSYDGFYWLVSGKERLKPGQSVSKEFDLEITGNPPADGTYNVAKIYWLAAELDYERFFDYYKVNIPLKAFIRRD